MTNEKPLYRTGNPYLMLCGDLVKGSEREVAQSCPTLCDPVDCSLPGSSVHGIFQARVLEWVAISFSWGSSRPRDWTQVSRTAGRHFTVWATREAQMGRKSKKEGIYIYTHTHTHIYLTKYKTMVWGINFIYLIQKPFGHLKTWWENWDSIALWT